MDDNSPDKTQLVVKELQKIYGERLVLHTRPGKLGLGSAYIDGLQHCKGEFIFLMDADLSHHVPSTQPKFFPQFIRKQRETGADIVTGTRYVRTGGVYGWNLTRKLTSRVANFIADFLLNPEITDLTGSFRLYKRPVLEEVMKLVKQRGYVFQTEAVVRAREKGYSIEEVPITFVDRILGESKLGPGEIITYLKGLWVLLWDARFG